MSMSALESVQNRSEQKVEVLIIGAGLIGSSLGMHLAKLGMHGVRGIDFDLEGTRSSSELNAGGVRATFNHPLNIAVSKLSIEYFAEHAEEVGYRPCGYLWLQTPEKMAAALKARELQTTMGWPVEVWDVPTLRAKMPFMDRTDDLAGAFFSPRDGLINPNLLKNHFRTEARAQGAQWDDRTLVRKAEQQLDGSWIITCEHYQAPLSPEQKTAVLSSSFMSGATAGSSEVPSTLVKYHAQKVVNCAGPWAAGVAEIFGYEAPCYAQRRQVSVFDCRGLDFSHHGMIIDTSGVYFHPEAMNILAGIANRDEPRGVNFTYDGSDFFEQKIWMPLAERSSAFESLKHLTGWAGLYEVSPDESAIIGRVEAGNAARGGRVFEAHSFSGHGAMHSPAAGLALAELIVHGRYETLDLSPLSATRFEKGQFIRETAVI